MADIPGANPDPTVAPDRMPTPYDENRVSPEAFGAGAGAQLERQSGELAKVGAEYQQRDNFGVDEAAIARAYGVVADKIRNPQTGFMALRGQDAIGKLDQTREDFAGGIAQIRQRLTPAQVQRIGFRLDRIEKDGLFDAESWAKQQGSVAREAAFHGAETAAADRLAQLAGDPTVSEDRLQSTLLELTGTATSRAKSRYGESASPDAIKGEVISTVGNAVPKAMSEALSTGNPQHAEKALMLFGPYLGVHAKQATAAVNTMLAQQTIATNVHTILGKSMPLDEQGHPAPVALPDGGAFARYDEGRAMTALAALPDGPHKADIAKVLNQELQVNDTAWKKTLAQHVDAAKKAGDPTGSGTFDMDTFKTANPALHAFLNANDHDALISLAQLQDREDARERAADRADSRQAHYDQMDASTRTSGTVESQIVDKANRDQLLKHSPEEFQSNLLHGKDLLGEPLIEPLVGKDINALVKSYRQAQKDAGANLLDEKPAALVGAAIERAADFDPYQTGELKKTYLKSLTEKATLYAASHKGTVTTEDLTKYIDAELADAVVPGVGWFGSNKTMRRIDAEQRFPKETPPYETPQAPAQQQAAPAPAPAPQPQMPALAPLVPPTPAPKAITGYRFNKDKTKRIPVYSDGSQGPVEDSK